MFAGAYRHPSCCTQPRPISNMNGRSTSAGTDRDVGEWAFSLRDRPVCWEGRMGRWTSVVFVGGRTWRDRLACSNARPLCREGGLSLEERAVGQLSAGRVAWTSAERGAAGNGERKLLPTPSC